MTARRDADRLLRTYLEDGPTELPDRSYDAVRAHIDNTRQRVVFGPWREPDISKFVALATAAAAVLVVAAVVGLNLMPRQGPIGGPGPTSTPTSSFTPTLTASPSPSPTAIRIEPADYGRALTAGIYYVDDPFPVHVSFTVPSGWEAWAYTWAGTQINLTGPDVGGFSLEIVDNVTADPCTNELLDPPVGPSIDELVTALSNLSEFGFAVSPATDITIDGFRGKQLTVQAPPNKTPECDGWLTWRTTTRQNGVGPGEINELRILDVDGVRLMIAVAADESPGARSEVDAVLESLQISE